MRLAWMAAVLITTLAGCSHYGFVEPDGASPPLAVWTIAAPAQSGVDASRLTRVAVANLRDRGLAARWEQGAGGASLRCSLRRAEVDGYDSGLFARADLACELLAPPRAPRHFEATGRFSASRRSDEPARVATSHAALQEAAALDALDRLSDDIARAAADR